MIAPEKLDVAIVGAGPVGLFLGHLLVQRGLSIRLFERRQDRDVVSTSGRSASSARQQSVLSRAIGIHPVSLELMQPLDLAAPLIAAGRVIRRGHALRHMNDAMGTLDFHTLPGPFPFVLSIPQNETERILEERLIARAGLAVLERGSEVMGLDAHDDDGVVLRLKRACGEHEVHASWVVGCDGKQSTIRQLANLAFEGTPYADHFVMGDFSDNTPFGAEAAIFLHPAGLIESFPLPHEKRRWVVRTTEEVTEAVGDVLVQIVNERVGHDLSQTERFMESPFGVQHLLAEKMARGRVLLAGDAAHIVSPIGGQGMNLGFKDAQRLALAFDEIAAGTPPERAFARYDRQSRKVAARATRRSAFYMRLGRPQRSPFWRDQALRLLLATPLRSLIARVFTMRGLEPTPS
ncbi:MAG: FAD-dependent monooxygenase [Deltaproteobacteria bacterium]|nr:FAD-dependent monooxygenase [Deltaproteobacteria bacterium]